MSRNKTLIIAVLFIWTLIGGYYFLREDPHSNHTHNPSRITAKLTAGVSVDFEMLTENPTINSPINVQATFTSESGSGDFTYRLIMPSNVELISPSDMGSFYLEENKPVTLPISFVQSVDYDLKVHLAVSRGKAENMSMFTFSTLDFYKNKEEVENLQNRKKDYNK